VGVLTFDDAMNVLQEETTDDMFDKVGLIDITYKEAGRSHKLLKGSFFLVFSVRVPFLILTLAGGMAAGAVIEAFEDILSAVVATAVFIPVIMDMGGNVGTQSSTIFTRGLVLGQINMRRFFTRWGREVLFGFGMAVVLGALGGLIAGFWQQMPAIGLAVGVSLMLTITAGTSLGFLVPFVLIKIGFDQAAGADPIITTIKNMIGLVIYFASVSFFLPESIVMA
jgi:magnesium transporter